MRFYTLFVCLVLSLNAFAQQTYLNKKEDTHYCGPVTEAQLREGDFANWFTDEDPEFELPDSAPAWAANLSDAKVEVYLGTWCGDSKTRVPRFINYWKAAGLNPDQLSFVALYWSLPASDERLWSSLSVTVSAKIQVNTPSLLTKPWEASAKFVKFAIL